MVDQGLDKEEIRRMLQDEAMKLPDLGIVVSGISGRFPKADSLNEFEDALFNGKDMLNDNDSSRFECGLWNLPPRHGRLKDISKFDNEFFNITDQQANETDHQMRILYEVVYEAILDAGVNPADLRGSNTGVYVGAHTFEVEQSLARDKDVGTFGYFGQLAPKVAKYFDFRGCACAFDSACASVCSALHAAVTAMDEGLIDQAIVASSNIPVNPFSNSGFADLQMLSPTGYCYYLDARANGYVKSEACVAILLQKKKLALRNYCSILTVLGGTDGFKPEGITFPSARGQASLINQANTISGVTTNHIEYIEAHGTGTPAGDPIECEAIADVYFKQKTQDSADENETLLGEEEDKDERKIGPLLIGSVKSNMGHGEGASGLCALAKVALMLENELIYKSLHYEQPNPNIKSLIEGKLKPVVETQKLSARIVPMSNYGFGGANSHVIVRSSGRQAIGSEDHIDDSRPFSPRLIVMFGRTEESVNSFFDSLLDENSRHTRNGLTEDCLALIDSLSKNKIDHLMNYRGYLIADRGSSCGDGKRELARNIQFCHQEQLMAPANEPAAFCESSNIQDAKPRKCNLVLPGLGCQWPKMAAHLMSYKPFWSTIERLSEFLTAFEQKTNLIHLLTSASAEELNSSISNQFVSIIAYEIALINIIRDQLGTNHLGGIVGHSIGEVACAYAVGLLDERQAILVAQRLGKTLDQHSDSLRGKMVALDLSEHDVLELLKGYQTLRVSCVNGPSSVTISGRIEEVDKLCAIVADNVRLTHIESSSIALHNETIMTQDIKNLLQASILEVIEPPRDGSKSQEHLSRWHTSVDLPGANDVVQGEAGYFADCLCRRVIFDRAIENLEDDSVALELGPSGIFGSQLREFNQSSNDSQENKRNPPKFHYVRLMQRDSFTDDSQQVMRLLRGIGDLYLCGITFSRLTEFHKDSQKQVEELFPVRRQTPSLSSLIQWKHDKSFFVPRYPLQFSKSLSRITITINLNDLRRAYIMDHQVEGRILFPATGYLLLVWQYFSRMKTKNDAGFAQAQDTQLLPVEFHDVKLLNACVLTKEHPAELLMRLEFSTGQFEIMENDNLLVQGFIRIASDSSSDSLYEETRRMIEGEKLNAKELKSEDIYKHFRVFGYDYGECFQNIVSSSQDGRHLHVKYNGYYDSFTDSILQSVLLAMKHNGSDNGIFLPTGFDYVRFQPSAILKKLSETDTPFSIVDRERSLEKETKSDEKTTKPTSVFNVFCDPLSGVIITDGIQMKGIKMTLAPRRSDNNKVLLESYQFVRDIEDPIQDISLAKREKRSLEYVQVCNSIALSLIDKLGGEKNIRKFGNTNFCESYINDIKPHTALFNEKYLNKFLTSVWDESGANEEYNIKRNGNFILMSMLDQLSKTKDIKDQRKIVEQFKTDQLHDHIQLEMTNERLVRSSLEVVIENACQSGLDIRVLEINQDKALMKNELSEVLINIEPLLSLDYVTLPTTTTKNPNASESSMHDCSDLSERIKEAKVSGLKLVVYKDHGCNSLSILNNKEGEEAANVKHLLDTLANPLVKGGFMMVFLRQEMTLAELIVILMRESPQLFSNEEEQVKELIRALSESNKKLRQRCQTFIDQARGANLMLVSKRSDKLGSTTLLFRKCKFEPEHTIDDSNKLGMECESAGIKGTTLIRVTHDNREQISDWLEKLKANFAVSTENKEEEEENNGQERKNIVWLCGLETRQQCVSGLIGMMQALRKELDSQRLRCFYDAHTFKQCDEPIDVEQIEQSENFKRALERDLVWNCVDAEGQFGSFRHFTVNEYLNYEECLCANNSVEDEEESGHMFLEEDKKEEKNGAIGLTKNNNNNNTINGTVPTAAAYVNYAKRGDLSSFSWYELPLKYLDKTASQTICQVAYAALNFKDIMLATGRLSLDSIPIELASQDCVIGFEFSGLDSNQKRVMGMVPSRAIATHVLCPRETSLLVEVPDWMSLEEAATIPVVYATAIMALIYRGKMQSGESILIHAGSGGVGQAAIRLAAHYGLTIYTTVGSEEKKKFLLEEFSEYLQEERIFSSRDCNFEEQIMKQTHGLGVDLVLNSLADDKLRASIRCLADGGRFLEIGKYDMSVNSDLELLKLDTNKTFHGISLDKFCDTTSITPAFSKQLHNIIETIMDGLSLGYVKPINRKLFKRDQIEEAFRFMATGKHIGKVLVEIAPTCDKPPSSVANIKESSIKVIPKLQLSNRKTYVVTGGLGGFGLELIKWLAQAGAVNFVITSRGGIRTSYQKQTLDKLSYTRNANFHIVDKDVADTTTREGVEELCRIALNISPDHQIGGIFHLAMVLKDSLLENLSAEDFDLVCRPKIDTFNHLDRVTRDLNLPIDYFVGFSSVASGKGNAGQSNYAYANSCLERICEKRRADGLYGLAIQWGAIGDVGVAYENLGGNDVVIGGTIPQRLPSCFNVLGKFLSTSFSTCLSVLPFNRSQNGGGNTKGDLVATIMHVLGIKDPSKVSECATLGELGLDSLMAVEIRQYIMREYDITLNTQEIRSLTIAKIREINSQEKSSVKNVSNVGEQKAEDKVKHVESYGLQDKTNENANKGVTSHNTIEDTTENGTNLITQSAFMSIRNRSNFIPALQLPLEDYSFLNDTFLEKNHNSNGVSNGQAQYNQKRPIFFIPPIHGGFEQLKKVCSNMKRPCIGINWTRRFGKAQNMQEIVMSYIHLLSETNWTKQFKLQYDSTSEPRVVDLVGYSFGATVAFELMIALHKMDNSIKQTSSLKPGRLILLDGSPRQIELGSSVLNSVSHSKPMKLNEKIDNLLMVYVIAHTQNLKKSIDLNQLYRDLSQLDAEQKVKLVSRKLVEVLDVTTSEIKINGNGSNGTNRKTPNGVSGHTNGLNSFSNLNGTTPIIEKDMKPLGKENFAIRVSHAVEAFCRRYEIIHSYKAIDSLPTDCTLIRANEFFMSNKLGGNQVDEDLGVSNLVDGKTDLFIFKGGHEDFLDKNHQHIADLIYKQCTLKEK